MYQAASHIHFADGDHTTVEGPELPSWGNAHDDIGRRIERAVEENQIQVIRVITRISHVDAG